MILGKMTTAGLFLTIALMFIGGSPGGTGGGIKTTTIRVLTSCEQFYKVKRKYYYERQVPISLILKAIGVLFGSIATVIISTMLITLTDPQIVLFKCYLKLYLLLPQLGFRLGSRQTSQ